MNSLKSLLLCCVILTSFVAVAQHQAHEIGFAYNFMKPYENMQEHIQRGHGFSLDYYFHPKNKRFAAGLELNYNLYGRDKSRQVYTFPDNSTGEADIVVYNNFSTLMLGGRYYLGKSGTFQPFINAKLGYAWLSTELNIYDPADWDQCEPLDREVLLRDGTPSSAFGAGFQFDLDKKRPNTFMLQMQSNMLLGNHVKYMSVRAPVNQAPHQQHNQPDEVRARFINNQTQIVHEHHVGNVYSNLLRTLDFRLGFSYRFN